ncbi:Peptidase C39 family protein [Desulfonatronum thiosulfatophilum]|uniref:Peptidase C39 family protein n=1 Tax=Desulfonatronum thiosulfatophilum TaxID=617002 RepID=A0A1G6CK50_9BACT|nr:cysteine peptidase family C39 domain-containing protein [Desulfonatronum thiosulfatophilum]SDB33274.1 Peptidase C39 family protein [Desulfonatronum thiosulfatophilum]
MIDALSFNKAFLCLLLALGLFGQGCGSHSGYQPLPELPEEAVFLNVPFVPQSRQDDCGPAALASVLMFRGHNPSLDDITRDVFTPALGRTLLPDMENHARDLGFQTKAGRGDPELLKDRINNGSPVIILLEMGRGALSRGHYVVVFGHTREGYLMHVGELSNVLMPTDELVSRWGRMNNLYLVVE